MIDSNFSLLFFFLLIFSENQEHNLLVDSFLWFLCRPLFRLNIKEQYHSPSCPHGEDGIDHQKI